MKIAIMQPYIFPYIAYFQLIAAVDKFIFLDNVNFIKKGWINRNRLCDDFSFTIPCVNISQNKYISETEIDWQNTMINKLIKTIEMKYSQAKYFSQVFEIINGVFASKAKHISNLAMRSIRAFAEYFNLATEFAVASESKQYSTDLKGSHRLIDILQKERASIYINAIGGMQLYSKQEFASSGIELKFLKTTLTENFAKDDYVSFYSIIDVAMHNSPDRIGELIKNYELI